MCDTATFTNLLGDSLLGKDQKAISTADALSSNPTVIGLYFSAHWCPPCRGFTPELAKTYTQMMEDKKSFEIIFISSDRDESSFKEYHSEMPWLALPYEARSVKDALSKKYNVRGIPTLVLLDAQGNLITTQGRSRVSDPEAFPWTPKPFSELIGDSFVTEEGETVGKEAIAGKILGIYFSAHWCPPCRGFTPKLSDTYKKLKEDGKDFEIIFVSSDRDESSFKEYQSEMPWLALPFSDRKRKEELSELFEVNGIPALIMVDVEGNVITDNARSRAGADPEGKEFPWHPKPVNDLAEGADGINDTTSLVILMENTEAGTQAAVEEALHAVAEKEISSAKAKGEDPWCFFTAKSSGGVVPQIRKLCSLPTATANTCTMLLMDIPNDGSFYIYQNAQGSKTITAENIRDFVSAYSEKKLTRKQLS